MSAFFAPALIYVKFLKSCPLPLLDILHKIKRNAFFQQDSIFRKTVNSRLVWVNVVKHFSMFSLVTINWSDRFFVGAWLQCFVLVNSRLNRVRVSAKLGNSLFSWKTREESGYLDKIQGFRETFLRTANCRKSISILKNF